jgi:hypothetical protein
MTEMPLTPAEVAVMTALPTATAVTTPVALTVAFAGRELDQVTSVSTAAVPSFSVPVAVSACVWPMVMVAASGVTSTDLSDGTGSKQPAANSASTDI